MVALTAFLKSSLIFCVLSGAGLAFARATLSLRDAAARPLLFRTQGITLALAAVLAVSAFALLVYRLGGSLDPGVARIVATSPPGYAAGLIIMGACFGFARRLAVAGGVLIVAAFAIAGHAAAGSIVDGMGVGAHVAAGAWWTGGLLILAATGRGADRNLLASRLQRFSRQAVPVVLLLLLAGGWAALQLLGWSLSSLTTDYGLMLLLKIAFAAGALSIALYNRLRLAPAIAQGDIGAERRLGIAITVELLLISAVVIATGILTSAMSPPGMAGSLASSGP